MADLQVANINVVAERLLPTPEEIKAKLPLSPESLETVYKGREAVQAILDRKDHRLFLVVGPCSIHDLEAAQEYSEKLARLATEVEDTFLVLMRVYFSKPRTTVGWRGYIIDPCLDDSFQIDKGLFKAREFLRFLAQKKLPVATEALDPITPQYIDDLVSWSAIGARTAESQTHREMASGLSTAVGVKNGTDGSLQIAINALKAVNHSHHFLGINEKGQCAVLQTRGNSYGHMVLRGGNRPNYDSVSIALCEKELRDAGLPVNIMVDCSHGNSLKDPNLQPLVMDNCVSQILEGNTSLVGLMLESNLRGGKQALGKNRAELEYGVSITDGCIDWKATEDLIKRAQDKLVKVLPERMSVG